LSRNCALGTAVLLPFFGAEEIRRAAIWILAAQRAISDVDEVKDRQLHRTQFPASAVERHESEAEHLEFVRIALAPRRAQQPLKLVELVLGGEERRWWLDFDFRMSSREALETEVRPILQKPLCAAPRGVFEILMSLLFYRVQSAIPFP